MADLAQVTAHIRFGIEQLSAQNGHHEFEHLCRQFARLRISPHVIPASGPVSAGGDQGRDFETFRSFLKDQLGAPSCSWLAAEHEGTRMAFACTLQNKNLKSKIQEDVAKIAEGKLLVTVVYYFIGGDFPVAKRHELQDWAIGEYGIELELIDAGALSEQLSSRDLFWIAERYLRISREIYPPFVEDEENQYLQKLNEWKTFSDLTGLTYSQFNELKELARFSLSERKEDANFWIGALDIVAKSHPSNRIRYLADYEFLAVSARLTRSFIGLEQRVTEFIGDISDFNGIDDAENKYIISSYACSMTLLGACNLDLDQLRNWCQSFIEIAERNIAQPPNVSQLCFWLRLRGTMELQYGVVLFEKINVTKLLHYWTRFVEALRECPLFPIGSFKDMLDELVRHIGDEPGFEEICGTVDQLIALRAGGEAAAESCRDRGIAYFKAGNILKAIRQFQQAKIGWFTEDALEGSLMACRVLSSFYEKLGLNFAAKYFALVESSIAWHSSEPALQARTSSALIRVGMCSLVQGQWFSYWNLQTPIFIVHQQFTSNPWDRIHSDFWENLASIFQTKTLTERYFPELAPSVNALFDELKLEAFAEMLELSAKQWVQLSHREIEEIISAQFDGYPWSDVGPSVNYSWNALGVSWNFTWQNEHQTVSRAEEITALFQIAIASLAGFQTCMLSGEVDIFIELDNVAIPELEFKPSNKRSIWHVKLPRKEVDRSGWLKNYYPFVIDLIVKIVRSNCLLKKDKFDGLISEWFKEVSTNGFFGERYKTAFEYFWSGDVVGKCAILHRPDSYRMICPSSREDVELLYSKCDVVAALSEQEITDPVKRRYESCMPAVKITVKRLKSQAAFQTIRKKLADRGWKDWHLLLSIYNIAMNYRYREVINSNIPPKEREKLMRGYLDKIESEGDAEIPLEEFSLDSIERCLHLSMLNTLQTLGLHCHQPTPNFDAISNFLGENIRYWEVDVKHSPIFDDEIDGEINESG